MLYAKTSVVVLNFNGGDLVRECVESVLEFCGSETKVILVDNASTDGSAELDTVDQRLVVIKNERNLGFAAGVNVGLRACRADTYLVLNPDTRLFADTLERATTKLYSDPRIGVLGVKHVDQEQRTAVSCSREPTAIRLFLERSGLSRLLRTFGTGTMAMIDFDHESTRSVDQVMGAFMLIRGRILHEFQLYLDEDYFVYYEDVQFCKDVRRLGYEVVYYPEARIFHLGKGTTDKVKSKRLLYSLASSIRYADKNFGILGQGLVRLAVYGIEPILRFAQAYYNRDSSSQVELKEAYKQLYFSE